jgi:hypothetical protein
LSSEPFPTESLPANRQGRLSDEQRERYRRIARKKRRHFLTSGFAGHLPGFGGRGLADDVRAGVVEVDQGTVVVSDLDGPLWASVDDRRMRYGPLTRDQQRALGWGPISGRLYYLPRSKLVVNFETVHESSAPPEEMTDTLDESDASR